MIYSLLCGKRGLTANISIFACTFYPLIGEGSNCIPAKGCKKQFAESEF